MYLSDSIFAASPSSVDEPNISVMLLDLFIKEVCVNLRLERKESLSETSGESRGGLFYSLFSTCHLGSVSRVEVIDCLLGSKFGDGWED